MSDANPPPEVAAAAKIVDDWLKGRPPVAAAAAVAPAPETARMSFAQRFDHARKFDQTKMPPWKDPRGS
jgi:hypothetical protein